MSRTQALFRIFANIGITWFVGLGVVTFSGPPLNPSLGVRYLEFMFVIVAMTKFIVEILDDTHTAIGILCKRPERINS